MHQTAFKQTYYCRCIIESTDAENDQKKFRFVNSKIIFDISDLTDSFVTIIQSVTACRTSVINWRPNFHCIKNEVHSSKNAIEKKGKHLGMLFPEPRVFCVAIKTDFALTYGLDVKYFICILPARIIVRKMNFACREELPSA